MVSASHQQTGLSGAGMKIITSGKYAQQHGVIAENHMGGADTMLARAHAPDESFQSDTTHPSRMYMSSNQYGQIVNHHVPQEDDEYHN